MPESILFLTGHLARPRLEAVLSGMKAGFDWKVLDIGVKVAALMTEDIIARRLPKPVEADKIMLPGRCRADLDRLSQKFGVPFVRGPDELKDIPSFFGRARKATDMTKYDIQIFAEIVDASALARRGDPQARRGLCAEGRQRDRSRLPARHAVPASGGERSGALKEKGYKVSVNSANADELLRGGKAGADYPAQPQRGRRFTSPTRSSRSRCSIPKEHGDMASLYRAMDALDAKGRNISSIPCSIRSISASRIRSSAMRELRRERPKAEMLMGTGNLTELTDADTTGITAILLGIASELHIRHVLVVQVSPHTRRTVEEHDLARRIMYASRAEHELPKDYADGLLALHARRPFPQTPEEIARGGARGARQEFPHRDRRGRHPCL